MADRPGWALRPAAEADLSEIWAAGLDQWGAARTESYVDGLFAVFALLAAFPGLGRERPEFSPPVRIHPCGAHLVIYLASPEGPDILRILHMRLNWTALLQE